MRTPAEDIGGYRQLLAAVGGYWWLCGRPRRLSVAMRTPAQAPVSVTGSDHCAELTANSDYGAEVFAHIRYALAPAPESA